MRFMFCARCPWSSWPGFSRPRVLSFEEPSMRDIPAAAIDFVSRWEGCRLAAYQDVAGVWTIGYGSTGPHVRPGLKITADQAKALLCDDVRVAAARLEARIGAAVVDELSEDRYAALLSFTFNLGASPDWT